MNETPFGPLGRYLPHADAIDHVALECGAHGYSRTQIAACIGISRDTLTKWIARYPRFAEVMQRADTLSQAWWEGRAMDGTAQSRIGGTIWAKSMQARFPADYTERVEQGAIGDGARLSKIEWEIVDPEEGAA
jgi:hypothetical protein